MTSDSAANGSRPRGIEAGARLAGYRVRRVVYERPGLYTAVEAVAADRGRFTLKIVAPEIARDEELARHVVERAQLRASIRHPSLLPVECGHDGDLLYIATPRPRALTLADWLRDGRLPPEETVALLNQVAVAVDVAAARGLLHAELEPENIFVVEGRRVRALLGDFGIALPGAGEPSDLRSSVYSLGRILAECLTGRATSAGQPPRVSEQNADVPPAVDHVVASALAKDARDRFDSASELMLVAQSALEARPAPRAPRPRHRVPARALAVLLIATIAGLAIGAATTGGGGSSRAAQRNPPSAPEARALNSALAALRAKRAAGLDRLGTAASSEAQAAAAARLARDYRQARHAATGERHSVVRGALARVQHAYAQLATAARAGNARGYEAARLTVAQREVALQRTLGNLP